MNDKCCRNCNGKHMRLDCPFMHRDFSQHLVTWNFPVAWDLEKESCSRYSPLPDKPGKIEPIKMIDESSCYIRDDLFRALNLSRKINEIIEKIGPIIAAHNGRNGK